MHIFSIIILAAGRSQRMGTVKQLLPWNNTNILQHVIDIAFSCHPTEVILVLGYKADEIQQHINRESLKIIINPEFQKGMSSSIKMAIPVVCASSKSVMFMLGDQPMVKKEVMELLLKRHFASEKGITLPIHNGIKGRPVILDKKYFTELETLVGDYGARQVIDRHPDDVLEIEVDDEGVLIDIDTPTDYQRYFKKPPD